MESELIAIPGLNEPVSLKLDDALASLREKALACQRQPCPGIPEIALADARAWSTHTADEDWLIWRARRCAERLASIPFDLEPGERIIGKPLFHPPTAAQASALDEAKNILSTIPPYPGGDSGHFHPDYDSVLSLGLAGVADRITRLQTRPGLTSEQGTFYDACQIVIAALARFIRRAGDECAAAAASGPDGAESWRTLAAVCHRLAVHPPATFHEALQLMFLCQIALWFGEDHGLTSPGRLDRTLRRFYAADKAAGRLTPQDALGLLNSLFVQQNRILWPGSAVAVMVGGRNPAGEDETNDLTYLCLAARLATHMVYPTVGLAWHSRTPRQLMQFAARTLASGIGDPAFFNDDLITDALQDHGVWREDAGNYMNSTCVEIKVVGASNMWVTAPYFNCPQSVLDVMAEIADGKQPEAASFAEFQERVRANLANKIRSAARDLDAVWKARAKTGCFPLASCFIRDCLERGTDYDRGGARYNWVENSFVGLANLVDSLNAVKAVVFDQKLHTMKEFQRIVAGNFDGYKELRQQVITAVPKYGNDDDAADTLASDWAALLAAETESHTVGLHRYVPGFFCWVIHERFGSETGATPDGRLAGLPLADGAGAAQGRELNGPTAAVLSTTKWSHRKALGGVVHNIKFARNLLRTPHAQNAMIGVLETYLRRGGLEIQVNVVGSEVLLDAQQHPERYADLVVRVAGYSDYFTHLNRKMQDEVISRTEHRLGA